MEYSRSYRINYANPEGEIYRTPASFLETKIPYGEKSGGDYMKRLPPADDFPRRVKYFK